MKLLPLTGLALALAATTTARLVVYHPTPKNLTALPHHPNPRGRNSTVNLALSSNATTKPALAPSLENTATNATATNATAPQILVFKPDPQPTRLNHFCPSTKAATQLCETVQRHVSRCIEGRFICGQDSTRSLLSEVLAAYPCASIKGRKSWEHTVCSQWTYKTHKCLERNRRGKCGLHHQYYLLKQFRDLHGLKGE